MSDELIWEDPPASKRVESRWGRIAEQLREHPGKWALVSTYQSQNSGRTTTGHIHAGRLSGFTRGEYEATSRLADGQIKVYARYIGL